MEDRQILITIGVLDVVCLKNVLILATVLQSSILSKVAAHVWAKFTQLFFSNDTSVK